MTELFYILIAEIIYISKLIELYIKGVNLTLHKLDLNANFI